MVKLTKKEKLYRINQQKKFRKISHELARIDRQARFERRHGISSSKPSKIVAPDSELIYQRNLKSVSGVVVALLSGLTVPIMLFSAFMNKAQSISILHSDLVNNFSLGYFNYIVSSINLDAQVGTFFGRFLNYIGNVSTFMVNKLSGLTDILSNLFDIPHLLQNIWNWFLNLFS